MLQIIVCKDPIPTRLLLIHHSTRTAVPAWRYDSSHLVFTGVTGNLGGLPYCNSPFRLSYVPRRKKRRLQQFTHRPSYVPEREKRRLGNAFPPPSRRARRQWQRRDRDTSTDSPGGRRPRHVMGVTARPLQADPRSAQCMCVHERPDEFKPDYMSQALAGRWV
jgi:hypothetical protein